MTVSIQIIFNSRRQTVGRLPVFLLYTVCKDAHIVGSLAAKNVIINHIYPILFPGH